MRKLRRFISLPGEDRVLLIRAFWSLAIWRSKLSLFPFRVISKAAREPQRSARIAPPLDRIIWAVETAARYVPNATCLTQSLALQSLLRRFGHLSSIHIGVAKGLEGGFSAHAWVEFEGRILLGGAEQDKFIPLTTLEREVPGDARLF
jgi:Transglutaminase-like superfamily